MWFVDVNYTVSDYVFRIKSFFCHKLSSILLGEMNNILEFYELGWINENLFLPKLNINKNKWMNSLVIVIQKVSKELGGEVARKMIFFLL